MWNESKDTDRAAIESQVPPVAWWGERTGRRVSKQSPPPPTHT